jgi:hypothetical protein
VVPLTTASSVALTERRPRNTARRYLRSMRRTSRDGVDEARASPPPNLSDGTVSAEPEATRLASAEEEASPQVAWLGARAGELKAAAHYAPQSGAAAEHHGMPP